MPLVPPLLGLAQHKENEQRTNKFSEDVILVSGAGESDSTSPLAPENTLSCHFCRAVGCTCNEGLGMLVTQHLLAALCALFLESCRKKLNKDLV